MDKNYQKLIVSTYDKIALKRHEYNSRNHLLKGVKGFIDDLSSPSLVLDVGLGDSWPIDDYLIDKGHIVRSDFYEEGHQKRDPIITAYK